MPSPQRFHNALIAETGRLGYRLRMGLAAITLAMLALAGPARAGATRCWIDRGAVVAAAAFGDIAGDFIIDVGAPVSELHVTRANSDGIDGHSAQRPLVLAGHRLAAVTMTVADLDALPQTDTSIAGIIGADVLSRYPVTIVFAPCRLTWGRTRSARAWLRLPVIVRGGVPTVQAGISDGVTVREEPMIVSTGRTETLAPGATLRRAPKAGSFATVRLRAVVVGGRLLEQVPAGVAEAAPGAIGTGVWRGWRAMRLNVTKGWLELRSCYSSSARRRRRSGTP
jgi:hypothetical protein